MAIIYNNDEDALQFWEQRATGSVNAYDVTLRHLQQVDRRQQTKQDAFLRDNQLEEAEGPPLVTTPEAKDLEFWCTNQSWSYV